MLPKIEIDERIAGVCPNMKIGLIRAHVINPDTPDGLWQEVFSEAQRIKDTYQLLEINSRPAVAGTRRLYKALGKDPGRYRVASEALCRRVIRGLGLYRLTAVVDAINVISIRSGYAISGLDADRLSGNVLSLGVGYKGELYEGIGRGPLNIENMPVYRDALGGVATPTSDEERTKITNSTTTVQININAFEPEMPINHAVQQMVDLLVRYAHATNVETEVITLQ